MKRLSTLLSGIDSYSHSDPIIYDLVNDSRHVTPGSLFFAYAGTSVDGRDYIAEAIRRGAVAIVYDQGGGYSLDPVFTDLTHTSSLGCLFLPRSHVRVLMGEVAARFFEDPSLSVRVIGVTGTNGKTSVTHFIAQALGLDSCAVLGTLGNGRLDALTQSSNTTLDAIQIHRACAAFQRAGFTHLAMEVSSHALDQSRVAGVHFHSAVFTNLTRDHLDYHQSMEQYAMAKSKLFQHPGLQRAVINMDDDLGRSLIAQHDARLDIVRYSLRNQGNLNARVITMDRSGFKIAITSPWGEGELSLPLLGEFNISNILATLGVLWQLEWSLDQAIAACLSIRAVCGRMQQYGGSGQPLVVIDYAHTPDALAKVLNMLRAQMRGHGRGKLWCIFGCGGDRDLGKRPMMGQIAAQIANYVVITNDNPRSEVPIRIAHDIISGMKNNPQNMFIILDRAEAIAFALGQAGCEDIILIAGKGHEMTQTIGDQVFAFNDAEHVMRILS